MKPSRLLLVDGSINLSLGVLLATFPKSVVDFLGAPESDTRFYPTILGAVLLGIGVALMIEYFRQPGGPAGLGLHGAIAINLCGAIVLVGWLVLGKLEIPPRGQIFLWLLSAGLMVVSATEFARSRILTGGQ
jgi:hypothetical protein